MFTQHGKPVGLRSVNSVNSECKQWILGEQKVVSMCVLAWKLLSLHKGTKAKEHKVSTKAKEGLHRDMKAPQEHKEERHKVSTGPQDYKHSKGTKGCKGLV